MYLGFNSLIPTKEYRFLVITYHCYVIPARKTDLGVASFGVSVTTMEEVFTKVGEGTDKYFNNRLVVTIVKIPILLRIFLNTQSIHSESISGRNLYCFALFYSD